MEDGAGFGTGEPGVEVGLVVGGEDGHAVAFGDAELVQVVGGLVGVGVPGAVVDGAAGVGVDEGGFAGGQLGAAGQPVDGGGHGVPPGLLDGFEEVGDGAQDGGGLAEVHVVTHVFEFDVGAVGELAHGAADFVVADHAAEVRVGLQDEHRTGEGGQELVAFVVFEEAAFEGLGDDFRVDLTEAAGHVADVGGVTSGEVAEAQGGVLAGNVQGEVGDGAGEVVDGAVFQQQATEGAQQVADEGVAVVGFVEGGVFDDDGADGFQQAGGGAEGDDATEGLAHEHGGFGGAAGHEGEGVFDVVVELVVFAGAVGFAVAAQVEGVDVPALGEVGHEGQVVLPAAGDAVEQDEGWAGGGAFGVVEGVGGRGKGVFGEHVALRVVVSGFRVRVGGGSAGSGRHRQRACQT